MATDGSGFLLSNTKVKPYKLDPKPMASSLKGTLTPSATRGGIAGLYDGAKRFLDSPTMKFDINPTAKSMAKATPMAMAIDGIINPTALGNAREFSAPVYDGSAMVDGTRFNLKQGSSIGDLYGSSDPTSMLTAYDKSVAPIQNYSTTNLPPMPDASPVIATNPTGKPKVVASGKGSLISPTRDPNGGLGMPPAPVPISAMANAVPTVVPTVVPTNPQNEIQNIGGILANSDGTRLGGEYGNSSLAGYGIQNGGYSRNNYDGTPQAVVPQDSGMLSSVKNWYNTLGDGSMSTPNGMSKADFQALPPETQAKLMSGKSGWETLGSTMSGVGSMAGGLAGIYGAYANAKYQKDQTNMQKAMIRGDEANKSAFAKAAGGTYQSSGV